MMSEPTTATNRDLRDLVIGIWAVVLRARPHLQPGHEPTCPGVSDSLEVSGATCPGCVRWLKNLIRDAKLV
jgi:hypothetical protein